MSTGAKIGLGAGAAALVLALVIGAIILLPTGDDEEAPSASPDTSETTAPEDDAAEAPEDEEIDDPLGDPADDPEPQEYTGSGDEVVELDEPHDDTRIISIESDGYVHVNLQESNGDPNGLAAGIDGTVNRELYNYRDNQGTTAQLEVLSTADSWTITLEPLSTADSWPDPDEPLQGEGSEIFVLGWETTDRELAMEHTGDSNFILWALDPETGAYENMANEVGDYESTAPVPLGTSIIQVSTAGEWTLTVS